jgi:hypothetical protein
MKRAMFIGLSAVATMLAAGCGGGSIGEPEGSTNVAGGDTVTGLLLDENSDTVTRGRFITTDGELSFFVISDTSNRILKVSLNGKTFDMKLDASVTIDGHDAVLTVADHALLQTLLGELRARFETATTISRGIETLVNFGSYLSDAPAGHVHLRLINGVAVPEGFAASASSAAPICLTKGATVTAKYTNKAGTTITQAVVVGSDWGKNAAGTSGNYSCMGGCGAGCPTSNGGKTKYLQDCLNHDTCSHNLNSSGGPFDRNGCADEFNAASDDYNVPTSVCPLQ